MVCAGTKHSARDASLQTYQRDPDTSNARNPAAFTASPKASVHISHTFSSTASTPQPCWITRVYFRALVQIHVLLPLGSRASRPSSQAALSTAAHPHFGLVNVEYHPKPWGCGSSSKLLGAAGPPHAGEGWWDLLVLSWRLWDPLTHTHPCQPRSPSSHPKTDPGGIACTPFHVTRCPLTRSCFVGSDIEVGGHSPCSSLPKSSIRSSRCALLLLEKKVTASTPPQPRAVAPRLAVFGVGAVLWKSTGSSPPLAARPADDSRLEECLGQTLWSQFLRTMKSSLWTLNLQPAGSGCRCPGLCKVSAGDCPWGGREANAWGCYWGEALGSQAAFSMTFAGQRCFGVVSDRPCRSDFTCTSMSFLK